MSGVCPVCRGVYALRKDGRLRKHPATAQGLTTPCDGSGQEPR